jgi:hypothetical protein
VLQNKKVPEKYRDLIYLLFKDEEDYFFLAAFLGAAFFAAFFGAAFLGAAFFAAFFAVAMFFEI